MVPGHNFDIWVIAASVRLLGGTFLFSQSHICVPKKHQFDQEITNLHISSRSEIVSTFDLSE